MPHIAITMYKGRSKEVKKEIALKVQNFIAEELNVDKKYISVSIEDVEVAKWNESMQKISDDIMIINPEV